MGKPDIRALSVRELSRAVVREVYTLQEAHEELARRKALGMSLDADEKPRREPVVMVPTLLGKARLGG